MTKQPEALRLADEFEKPYWDNGEPHGQLVKAAAELRRLHEVNEEMIHWMKYIQVQTHIGHIHDTASAAIFKAKEAS